MNEPIISIKNFYLAGAVLFLATLAGNLWNDAVLWHLITAGAKISSIATLLFNLLLAVFFFIMYNQQRNMPPMLSESDYNDMIEEAKQLALKNKEENEEN